MSQLDIFVMTQGAFRLRCKSAETSNGRLRVRKNYILEQLAHCVFAADCNGS